jgi:hypothetical protein
VSPQRHQKRSRWFQPPALILAPLRESATSRRYRIPAIHHAVKKLLETPERVRDARSHRGRLPGPALDCIRAESGGRLTHSTFVVVWGLPWIARRGSQRRVGTPHGVRFESVWCRGHGPRLESMALTCYASSRASRAKTTSGRTTMSDYRRYFVPGGTYFFTDFSCFDDWGMSVRVQMSAKGGLSCPARSRVRGVASVTP